MLGSNREIIGVYALVHGWDSVLLSVYLYVQTHQVLERCKKKKSPSVFSLENWLSFTLKIIRDKMMIMIIIFSSSTHACGNHTAVNPHSLRGGNL